MKKFLIVCYKVLLKNEIDLNYFGVSILVDGDNPLQDCPIYISFVMTNK